MSVEKDRGAGGPRQPAKTPSFVEADAIAGKQQAAAFIYETAEALLDCALSLSRALDRMDNPDSIANGDGERLMAVARAEAQSVVRLAGFCSNDAAALFRDPPIEQGDAQCL